MELIIKKVIGITNYTFVFTGRNLYEVITESQKLSFSDIHECGKCGSADLFLETHKAQNKYEYTTVKCKGCRASLTFGQKKEDPDVFYLRRNEAKEFDWKEYAKEESK